MNLGRQLIRTILGVLLVAIGTLNVVIFWPDTTSSAAGFFWPWSGIISLVGALVGTALVVPRSIRTRLWQRLRGPSSIYRGLFSAVVAVVLSALLVTSIAWIFIGFALYGEWTTELPTTSTTRADATRLVLTITAGIGASVALVVAYRRQSSLEEGRFLTNLETAARQLGDREAIVQLSGIYALVVLAEEPTTTSARQTVRTQQCINVLCAYLRLPYSPGSHQSMVQEIVTRRTWNYAAGQYEETRRHVPRPSDREVRLTIIEIIGQHLSPNAPKSWSSFSFNFRGATFDGGNFQYAQFGGWVDFSDAHFTSESTNFRDTRFSRALIDFRGARFSGGMVDFGNAHFSGKWVNFSSASFTGATVNFTNATFADGEVQFTEAQFESGAVDFNGAEFQSGRIDFDAARFDGSAVNFGGASFSGAKVSFYGARLMSGYVSFTERPSPNGALVSPADVDFRRGPYGSSHLLIISLKSGRDGAARLSGGTVNFHKASFSGTVVDFTRLIGQPSGHLDFTDPFLWDAPPIVPWSTGEVPLWVSPSVWPPPVVATHVSEDDE